LYWGSNDELELSVNTEDGTYEFKNVTKNDTKIWSYDKNLFSDESKEWKFVI